MYSISFRANPISPKTISQVNNKASIDVTLKNRFLVTVKEIKNSNQGKSLDVNVFAEEFNKLCNEFGVRASDYYRVFMECIRG